MGVLSLVCQGPYADFHGLCVACPHISRALSVPLFPPLHQDLLSPISLTITTLAEVRWNLNLALVCISFMIEDLKHFFMHLLIFGLYDNDEWKWHFIVALICISLWNSDEHFCICVNPHLSRSVWLGPLVILKLD